MPTLIVVVDPKDWPFNIPGVEVVAASRYLTDDSFSDMRHTKVFNLCRSYRYQNNGYYVSLLATARGHKPLPSVTTIQDLKSSTIIRSASDDLDEFIQRNLAPLQSDDFTLSIYFGRNMARRYDRLARDLFNLFPSPLLRAQFARSGEEWKLTSIRPIPASEVPEAHRPFLIEAATEYFQGRRLRVTRRKPARYDLAILHDPTDGDPPSNKGAMRKFAKAAEDVGFDVSFITQEDYGKVAEYDALFIRATTFSNHFTYRFASRAEAEGLAVIDDPESIVRCTNKVYLSELLRRHRIAAPRTLVVHRGNVDEIIPKLGLPVVLKQPDSAFSLGVVKVSWEDDVARETERLLDDSDLIVAQEFMPTDFDWRVGVFEGHPLYVCQYHMAKRHWQIVHRDKGGHRRYGKVVAVAVEEVPRALVRTAVRAASLVGDGLYGVDIKEVGGMFYVVEVNDNPNVDAGYEDRIAGDALYRRVMEGLMRRVEGTRRWVAV